MVAARQDADRPAADLIAVAPRAVQGGAAPTLFYARQVGQDVLDPVGQDQTTAHGAAAVGEGDREAAVDARRVHRLGHAEGGSGIGCDLGAGGGGDL